MLYAALVAFAVVSLYGYAIVRANREIDRTAGDE